MSLFDEQSNHMVIYSREGPMVGWILGAPRKKCQTPIKESTWTIEFNVRRTEHDYYRDLKSDKRSTHHLRVRRSTEYFICVIFITALVRTSSRASIPNDEIYEIQTTNRSLTRKARHQRNVMQQFTNRWRKEYLLNLREQSACISKEKMNLSLLATLLLLKTIKRIVTSGNWQW